MGVFDLIYYFFTDEKNKQWQERIIPTSNLKVFLLFLLQFFQFVCQLLKYIDEE
ncbi:hypothetical protein (plasmid) [Metabacillus dongyingensis]|nr:hypothetical protein [Metabacillus dongyingensis]